MLECKTAVKTVVCVADAKRGGGGGGGREKNAYPLSPIPLPFSLPPYPLPLSTPATQAIKTVERKLVPRRSFICQLVEF